MKFNRRHWTGKLDAAEVTRWRGREDAEIVKETKKGKRDPRQRGQVQCLFSHALISLLGPISFHNQHHYQMADPELAALRAARLNQLQQSAGVGGGNAQSGAGAGSTEEAEKRRAEEQMRRDLLATTLEPAARERRTCHYRTLSLILPQ